MTRRKTAPAPRRDVPENSRHRATHVKNPGAGSRARRQVLGITAASFVLATGMLLFFQLDGGAPPKDGDVVGSAKILVWTFAAGASVSDFEEICSNLNPCDVSQQIAAKSAGRSCRWTGTVWMPSGALWTPVLFDAEILAIVRLEGGLRVPSTNDSTNFWSQAEEFSVGLDGGTWWKIESEHVEVSFESPCDLESLRVSLNYSGRGLFGGHDGGSPEIALELHTDTRA